MHELASDREKALDALRRALLAGSARALVDNEPELAELRADARYAALTSQELR